MVAFSLAFLTGVLLLEFAGLSVAMGAGLLLSPALALRPDGIPVSRVFGGFLLGFTWPVLLAALTTPDLLPARWDGQRITVHGVVDGLPERLPGGVLRFPFRVEGPADDDIRAWRGRVRVSWYPREAVPAVSPGERWQLELKLKRPRGFANPGGFDYAAWLSRRGYGATAYVRTGGHNERLAPARGYPVATVRHRLALAIDDALEDAGPAGLVRALGLGDRSGIHREQWSVFRSTGTGHLVAISGLHVGLVAGICFALVSVLWRLTPWLDRVPAPIAGSVGAALAALCYATLAGFSIPTQRALLMLLVVLGAQWLRRPLAPATGLAAALLLVLLRDPPAVREASLWLSFCAVGLILWLVSGGQQRTRVAELVRVPTALAVGMVPLGLLFFQQASLVAPLANAVAVPLVSLLIIPLLLLSLLVLSVHGEAGAWLLRQVVAPLLDGGWRALEPLSRWPLADWQQGVSAWNVGLAVLGTLWLCWPGLGARRWLGAALFLPLTMASPDGLAEGEAELVLLDVGQGLAAVVRTRNHLLLYDTGPRFGSGRDTGELVVLPYLRHVGVKAIDRMMISHTDLDHIGGGRSVYQGMPVYSVMTPGPDELPWARARRCHAGQGWQWDGVRFEVLHPVVAATGGRENDDSCVLRVATAAHRFLLTGDIEAATERRLVAGEGTRNGLAADVLVVPHHGSRTSSTAPFVRAVSPRHAWVAAGHGNRWGFPKPDVEDRYRNQGSEIWITGQDGALTARSRADGELTVSRFRRDGDPG